MTPVHWIDDPDAARGLPADAAIAWAWRDDDPRIPDWTARSVTTPDDRAAFAGRRDAGERLHRRRLARLLLGIVSGCRPDAIRVTRTATGAPRPVVPEGWHMSVAGSAGHALIALARAPLGADIEALPADPLPLDLLTAQERAMLAALSSADRARASLGCWVAKEAHAKRLGDPRRLAPHAIDTRLAGERGTATSAAGTSTITLRHRETSIAAIALPGE